MKKPRFVYNDHKKIIIVKLRKKNKSTVNFLWIYYNRFEKKSIITLTPIAWFMRYSFCAVSL